jgi:hypothetical protein
MITRSEIPRNPGTEADGIAWSEAEHHMKCPGCGRWFDMRNLGEVSEHMSGRSSLQKGPASVYERRPPTEAA